MENENFTEEVKTSKKSKGSFKFVLALLVILIAAGGYGAAYYYFNQYKQTKIVLDNPEVASQNEVKEITDKLGKLYLLPEGEDPTVATVLDIEKLKDQPFFSKAENGDKVVIYSKSQLAILFRVAANKIITVAPISLQQNQNDDAKPVATLKPTEKPTPTEAPAE